MEKEVKGEMEGGMERRKRRRDSVREEKDGSMELNTMVEERKKRGGGERE